MLLDSGMCHITCDGRNGICLCFRWDNPTDFRLATYRSRLTKASEVMQRLLGNAWEGLKLTWDEWHMIVCGWGDGVALTQTAIANLIEGELHYYKFGLGLGRLTWALIIGLLLIRFIG